MRLGFLAQPICSALQPLGQQFDIKDLLPVLGLFFFQKVEQQGRQATLFKDAGDKLVARTEPAAAASVRECNYPPGAGRNPQDAA